MKLEHLIKGVPGHPLHPPLTDITIGTYTFATIAAILHVAHIAPVGAANAWWLALVVGLCSTVLTALTGFVDWIDIEWGSESWRAATAHLAMMLIASGAFLTAMLIGRVDYGSGSIPGAAFVLTLAGFALLTAGGWLGGSVVFVHGKRVLRVGKEPWNQASAPITKQGATKP